MDISPKSISCYIVEVKKTITVVLVSCLLSCAPSSSQSYEVPDYNLTTTLDRFNGSKIVRMSGNHIDRFNDGFIGTDPYQYLISMNAVQLTSQNRKIYFIEMDYRGKDAWYPSPKSNLLLLIDGALKELPIINGSINFKNFTSISISSSSYGISEDTFRDINAASSIRYRWYGTETYNESDLNKKSLANLKRFYTEVVNK